jgi:NADH-quinone oxidoreductase subunit L
MTQAETRIIESSNLWLIAAAPLAGAFLNGCISLIFAKKPEKAPKTISAAIAIIAAASTFVFTVAAIKELLSHPEGIILKQTLWSWIHAGDLNIQLGFQFDQLTAVMLSFITFVATLIHIYSVGYMHDDEGFTKFFTYLNLFLFSMILLVLGESMTVLFVGWEGVGLCSYLLISFWYTDPEKAEAGKKAFITNRIGDAGFLISMFVVFGTVGTLSFTEIQSRAEYFTIGMATVACIAMLVGASGKSAQIPLYVWLPDAMAGPTPVSALIHAATMVTAGVYLVARMHFLFAMSPVASTVVAITGALTALFAATIAVAQYDIKKVLAYSTVSQLGYMFLGVGVGAYNAGIFHVMTHAFFKACLFLGAGSVIHALHHEQDIRHMGGLLKKIPVTAITFLIAWLAIAGIPPFAGFFSKDEILWKTIATENHIFPWLPYVLFASGVFTAMLTAFYMTRLVVLTFFGSYRGHAHHISEHAIMTAPLVVLAVLSTAGGFVGVPHALGGHNWFEHFLMPVVGVSMPEAHNISHSAELPLMALSVGVALVGILAAFYAFLWNPALGDRIAAAAAGLKKLLENKWYIDEIYEALILGPVRKIADWVSFKFVDFMVIDGFVNGLGPFAYAVGNQMKLLQNGKVRMYLAWIFAGVTFLLIDLLIVRS